MNQPLCYAVEYLLVVTMLLKLKQTFLFSVQILTSVWWIQHCVEDRPKAHVIMYLAGTSADVVSVTMRITLAQQEPEASRA